ncbi:MAG TPA: hypothetical protein PK628_06770 [Chitinophagales bacterium]|nr:hypothetical protein [Chitinophagales bacterium]
MLTKRTPLKTKKGTDKPTKRNSLLPKPVKMAVSIKGKWYDISNPNKPIFLG